MSEVENLKEKLFYKRRNGWEDIDLNTKENVFSFCDDYIKFLNKAKTEREVIKLARKVAEKKGFKDIMDFEKLNTGDKVFYINRDKSMYLAIIGEDDIENGINIIGSHVDSPRLDLKPDRKSVV